MMQKFVCRTFIAAMLLLPAGLLAQRLMESLDRGIVSVRIDSNHQYIGWRLLASDPAGVAFNIYRQNKRGKWLKLNRNLITTSTNFMDSLAGDLMGKTRYGIRAVIHGRETKLETSGMQRFGSSPWKSNYLSVALRTPKGYTPNDVSVGDLDGDGQYELIVHMTGRSRDNSFGGFTDPPILDAYRMDGTFLWRINLGHNIREGAHYTQFMVYDLDGDGRAELVCKTADGTIDGTGKVLGDAARRYANAQGRILDGPEYLTVFDGRTGAMRSTVAYIPGRGDVGAWGGNGGNGGNDSYGNRANRFLACIAYLDGVHPSVVMCRGYYGRTVLAAWDFKDNKLQSRWVFDSKNGANAFSGQGNHNLAVADVDSDGKDEIVYGSMCVDDNGQGLYSTGLRHGDAVHVSDLDPNRAGQEVFGIHEIEARTKGPGMAMFDAGTGKILWTADPDIDVGHGLAADIDPRYPGTEQWGGSEGLIDVKGNRIGKAPRSCNFAIWWDGDLLRELLTGNRITKWDWTTAQQLPLFTATGCVSNNGSKATPALSADLFGDWREEVIFRTEDNQALRIYTTTIMTDHRFTTLMQNPQYRLSIAWQNVAYNQPPYPDYFLGAAMQPPKRPNIILVPHLKN